MIQGFAGFQGGDGAIPFKRLIVTLLSLERLSQIPDGFRVERKNLQGTTGMHFRFLEFAEADQRHAKILMGHPRIGVKGNDMPEQRNFVSVDF